MKDVIDEPLLPLCPECFRRGGHAVNCKFYLSKALAEPATSGKPTAGTWSVYANTVRTGNRKGYDIVSDANVSSVRICEKCTLEDAQLMAAAPELLDACKSLLMLSMPSDVSGRRMVEKAREAVANATGD